MISPSYHRRLLLKISPLFITALLFFLLERFWDTFGIPAYLIPRPLDVIKQFPLDFHLLIKHSLFSARLLFLGILFSFLWALFLLWLIALFPKLNPLLTNLAIMGQAIPGIAIAPLLIVYFGLGTLPKIAFVASFSFFPIFLFANDFLKSLPPEWNYFRLNLKLSKNRFFWKIQIWLALPSLLSGLRMALTYSLGTVIFVEWLGGEYGLGIFLARAVSSFSNTRIIMLALYITLISLSLVKGSQWLNRKIIYWQTLS